MGLYNPYLDENFLSHSLGPGQTLVHSYRFCPRPFQEWSRLSYLEAALMFVSSMRFVMQSLLLLLLLLFVFFWEFLTPTLADRLSLEFERQQVSLSLQDSSDLCNVAVRMVSACPLIPNNFCLLTKHLMIVPGAPITISITVTLMFHSFLSSLVRSEYLFLFSFSLIFNRWFARTAKSAIRQV